MHLNNSYFRAAVYYEHSFTEILLCVLYKVHLHKFLLLCNNVMKKVTFYPVDMDPYRKGKWMNIY